ncbi:MAG: DUF333 domain-containing protein [Candidatus Woesearchaeota archaeon]
MCFRGCVIVLALVALLVMAGCSEVADEPPSEDSKTRIANPAAKKCVDDGNEYLIENGSDGGQVGYCVLSDGTKCEAWSYFRGEC